MLCNLVWKYPGNSLDYLPKYIDQAVTKGWQPMNFLITLTNTKVYCPYLDRTICVIFDTNQRMIGLVFTVI